MARSSAVRALAPLAMLAAAGCQDYNFNPVGHCLVQPGNERVTLSDLSSADILFVVDDSGSMAAEQAKLAANFTRFVDNLDQTNAERAAAGLLPIDFHIAVTTTSVFWNYGPFPTSGDTCRSDCAGNAGRLVCCGGAGGTPTLNQDGGVLTCARAGDECGSLEHKYDFAFCLAQGSPAGVAVDGAPYPQGDFVSWDGNPRVLHFDKELYGAAAKNRQGFTRDELIGYFVGGVVRGASVQGNVIAGTCGSGQEQALQAARLAIQKALDGRQKDTFNLAGQAMWDPTSRTASATAEWPRQNSKLVIAFVGDEDDCSSPDDASAGVVMHADPSGTSDACQRDWAATDPAAKKQIKVNEFVDYFAGLGRPLGAAFIFPAEQTSCSGTSCTAGLCCQTDCPNHANVCIQGTDNCGAQAPGHRLVEAANTLRNRGADVITGSVCDPNFGALLDGLAEILKPPAGLELKTEPAEGQIALLRIADKNGQTKKTCNGPAPAGTAFDAAMASYDWWFTATADPGPAVEVSKFIYINHSTRNCEADPGETYSADYIALNPASGCTTRTDCQSALGGRAEEWGCYVPPGTSRGTCVCCAPGSTQPECQAP
jgi:hypothetical protein